MASCAAVGCTRHQKKNHDVTFFGLPKNNTLATEWVNRLKAKREDPLPKKVILCEGHFSAEMFDKSVDLERRFMKGEYIHTLSPC